MKLRPVRIDENPSDERRQRHRNQPLVPVLVEYGV
jgi:hypothetical protein